MRVASLFLLALALGVGTVAAVMPAVTGPTPILSCEEGRTFTFRDQWSDRLHGGDEVKVLGVLEYEGEQWCQLGVGIPSEPGWLHKERAFSEWEWSDNANYDSDQLRYIPLDWQFHGMGDY